VYKVLKALLFREFLVYKVHREKLYKVRQVVHKELREQ
jgi:hypothetical protein